MPEKQTERLISQSTVLSMGFTKSMIDKLLPPPILKRNPHGASSAPMKLWPEAVVLASMDSMEFKAMAEKAAARKAASEKAVETKRKKAESIACDLIASIHVTRWSMLILERETLAAKQDWFLEHGSADMAAPNTETLSRWMVNFVRHNLCEYDDSLTALFGLVGKESLYHRLKSETLSKIAEVYPELQAECMRQMKERG